MEAARGLQQLSGTVSNIGDRILNDMDDGEKLRAMETDAEMTAASQELEDSFITNPENDVNDPEYVANFTSQMEKRLERYATGFRTKAGRDTIGLMIRQQIAQSTGRIRKAQDDGKVAQIGRAYNETLIKYGNTLYQNPNMFVPILQKFTLMASTLTNITEAQRQQLMTDARTKLVQSAILGEAHVYGPEVALENLLAGTFDMYLDPTAKGQQITSLTNRIYTEKNRQKALLDEAGKANADSIVKNFWDITLKGEDSTKYLEAMKSNKHVTVAEYIAARKHSNGTTAFAENDDPVGVGIMTQLLHNFQHDDAYAYLMSNTNEFTANTFRNYASTIRQARRNEGVVSTKEMMGDRLTQNLKPGIMDNKFGEKMAGLARAQMQLWDWLQEKPNPTFKEWREKIDQLVDANRSDTMRTGIRIGVDAPTYSNENMAVKAIEITAKRMADLKAKIEASSNEEERAALQDAYATQYKLQREAQERLEYFRKGN
jgi:hypothetical protein